uniref:Putative ovule protein n=1 Tax=Solanum chacoense TaxID=4108 RepID=A0A0V0GW07_SOLCH
MRSFEGVEMNYVQLIVASYPLFSVWCTHEIPVARRLRDYSRKPFLLVGFILFGIPLVYWLLFLPTHP